MINSRQSRLAATTAMLVAVAAVTSASCARKVPRTYVVSMKSLTFQPAELTVARGDTIVWKDEDLVPHSSTAREGTWDSKVISADSSWRYVADKAGRYSYYCVFHPTMVGTIEVR